MKSSLSFALSHFALRLSTHETQTVSLFVRCKNDHTQPPDSVKRLLGGAMGQRRGQAKQEGISVFVRVRASGAQEEGDSSQVQSKDLLVLL